jgi:hypothetical protein
MRSNPSVVWLAVLGTALAVCAAGCEEDPPSDPDDGGGDTETGADGDADADADMGPDGEDTAEVDAGDTGDVADVEDTPDVPPPCEPLADDYTPRESGSSTDLWPACISDDNAYHPIEATIGTVARIASFEQIADLLWRSADAPTSDDFTAARVIYVDTNGLDSRIQRREDLHYPAVPAADGVCTDAGVPALYPDRCVGPGRILPIVNDAFLLGTAGTDPWVQAARLEAAFLWFLYLSPYKEAHTCTETPRDCDSAWAYYSGGEPRDAGLGLASYVRDLEPETHDRIWDGLLAIRCWKNLDHETGVSTDLVTRDRAIAQLDRAALRGVALVVRDRFDTLAAAATAEARRAAWAFLQILGGALDREATVRDATAAGVLRTELARTDPTTVDIGAAQDALDTLFPCP